MKIAYCSPFSPVKSGISDFSEELIQELKNYVEIELLYDTPIKNKDVADEFVFHDIQKLEDDEFASRYDLIVYQMGNNYKVHKCIGDMFMKRPGILEIHDLSLHHYIAAEMIENGKTKEYVELLKYCHGDFGYKIANGFLNGEVTAPWEKHTMELMVNKHFVDKATGVIVHSDMAKQMIRAIRPDVPIINIPLHVCDIVPNTAEVKSAAKKVLGIPEDVYLFGAFGFATKTKRIYQTLEAMSKYTSHDFRYVVVGQEIGLDTMAEAKRLGIEDKVIVTGYTSLEKYKLYMQACDVCINLRYPTNGESSANLQRILGMGIPAVITDIGTFSEYPDECALKVSYGEKEVSDILAALNELTSSKNLYDKYCQNALRFIQENACLENNCQKYRKFFDDILNGTFVEEDMVDRMLDKAFEVGIDDEEYLLKFTGLLNIL